MTHLREKMLSLCTLCKVKKSQLETLQAHTKHISDIILFVEHEYLNNLEMKEEILTSVSTVKQVLDDVNIKEEDIIDTTYSVKQEELGDVEVKDDNVLSTRSTEEFMHCQKRRDVLSTISK